MICLRGMNTRLGAKLTDTEHNETAVRYLKEAQRALGMNNREFARALGTNLGVEISETTYGYMVSGKTRRQPVPGAILVAAARLSGLPLLNQEQERTMGGRLERLENWMAQVEGLLRQLLPPGEVGPRFLAGTIPPVGGRSSLP